MYTGHFTTTMSVRQIGESHGFFFNPAVNAVQERIIKDVIAILVGFEIPPDHTDLIADRDAAVVWLRSITPKDMMFYGMGLGNVLLSTVTWGDNLNDPDIHRIVLGFITSTRITGSVLKVSLENGDVGVPIARVAGYEVSTPRELFAALSTWFAGYQIK